MNGKLQTSASNQSGVQALAGVNGTQILVNITIRAFQDFLQPE